MERPGKLATLASYALMPLIVPQGLYVKFRAAQLSEAAGDRAGRAGQGPSLRLLILGDSSGAGVGVPHQNQALAGQVVAGLAPFFDVKWHLQARCGATTRSTLEMLRNVPEGPWDVAITALGVNDVKNGVALSRYSARTARLYDTLQSDFGVRLIVASGMPPVRDFPLLPFPLSWALQRRAALFDQVNKDLIDARPNCTYLQGPSRLLPHDMASDGFHPGPKIYSEWGALATEAIRSHWSPAQANAQAKAPSRSSAHPVHFQSSTVRGAG